MQILLLLLAVFFVVGLLDAFSRACERVISAFAALVGGWRPDGWPRGIQEEDRDSRWGRPSASREAPPVRAPLTRVQSATHAR